MKMTIRNYAHGVIEQLTMLTDEYIFTVEDIQKSGYTLTSIKCKKEGDSVTSIIYVDAAYNSNVSAEDFAKSILNDIRNNVNALPKELESFRDFEKIKDRLYTELLPKNAYSEKYVRKNIADICAIVYMEVEFPNGQVGAIRITPEHIKLWGISAETLFETALANTREIECGVFMNTLVILKNSENTGASVVLEPGFDKAARRYYPEGYYIIPSSRMEVILAPIEADLEELYGIVSMVNSTLNPGEFLSNSVYVLEEGVLKIAQDTTDEVIA